MRKRDLIILLLALAAAVTVSVSVFAASAMETGSWGLSFRQEGMPPIGNAGRVGRGLHREYRGKGSVSDL